jgi:hypothetical protein
VLEKWAYVRASTSNTMRSHALTNWLHISNHHRAHTSLGHLPPVSRLKRCLGITPR